MRLQFLGAAGIVTGSCFLLDIADTRIMVDCGMFQGPKDIRERNYGSFPVPPRSVNYLLLTHAHVDHSGLIPKLVKHGFKGKILATPPTVELCEVLLPDSGYIQEMEVERKNRKNRRAGRAMIEPVYTVNEAYKSLSYFSLAMYDEIIQLTPNVRVRYVDAGHILGAAMIEIWVREDGTETKLVFSGDIGNIDRPLVHDPSTIDEADYVIMESTYGKRLHGKCGEEIESLHNVIWETYKKGGNLIIPAFAVERTQDLLYHLALLVEAKRMPPMTVYLDSPLATAATTIFNKYREYFDRDAHNLMNRGGDPLHMPGTKFTSSADESKALNNIDRAVIISASGMCEAGRIRHHLKYNLWRPESTVLFVGYQPEGTLGRQILDGEKKVRIFGDEIAVKADIKFLECYSAHADQAGLLKWISSFTRPPREVFLVHGEAESIKTLAERIGTELGLKVTIPEWQQSFELLPESAPGIVDDGLSTAYKSLAAKFQDILATQVPEEQKEEIIRRIAELEKYIDQETKRAAG